MSDTAPATESVPVDELRALREDARKFRQLVEAAKTRTVIFGNLLIIDGHGLRDAMPPDLAEHERCTMAVYGLPRQVQLSHPRAEVEIAHPSKETCHLATF